MGRPYVGRLAFLFSGVKQNHDDVAGFSVINPVSGTDIYFEFKNAAADRFRIAEKPSTDARQTSGDNLLRRRVERIQPFLKRTPLGSRLVVSNLDRRDLHGATS